MKKKIIIIGLLILFVSVIIVGALKIYSNQHFYYKNTVHGFSFIYSNKWRPAFDVSKIMNTRAYVDFYVSQTGCADKMFVKDYTADELSSKEEEFQKCLESYPEYKKTQENIQNVEANWSLENSNVIFLTDLSQDEVDSIIIEKGSGLLQGDLPKEHFIYIHLSISEPIEVKEPKIVEKDEKIIEYKLVDLEMANLKNIGLIDTRRIDVLKNDLGAIEVRIPYITKNNDEYSKEFKSIRIATGIPYGDSREKVFYQILDYFQFD